MVALLAAPSASFAFNTQAVAKAKSCCDDMDGNCGDSSSPVSCCKTALVQLDSHQILINFATAIPIAALLPFQSAEPVYIRDIHYFIETTDSPPPKLSHSL